MAKPPEEARAGLKAAQKVLAATMKHKGAKLLFNEAVDPQALGLPDYHEIVLRPLDLGTIHKRLTEGQEAGWESSFYRSAGHLFTDVSLVWENCLAYNSSPDDAPTQELCNEVKSSFEHRWRQAGLEEHPLQPPESEWLSEDSVPARFAIERHGAEQPLRFVDNFTICSASQGRESVSLSDVPATSALLRGYLVPSQAAEDQGTRFLETTAIREWCFEFGKQPCIWVVSSTGWYQLLRPAPDYAPLMAPQQQLLDVCAAAFAIREEEPGTANAECAREAVDLNAEGVDAEAAAKLAATAEAKLAAIDKAAAAAKKGKSRKRKLDSKGGRGSQGQAGAEGDASDSEPNGKRQRRESSDAGNDDPAGNGGRRRRPSNRWLEDDKPGKAPRSAGKSSGKASRTPLRGPEGLDGGDSQGDSSGDEALPRKVGRREADLAARRQKYAAMRAAEAQAREEAAKEKAIQIKAKAKREREAVKARGDPPPPCRAFRLPPHLVPDLLMVWELLQVLAPLTQMTCMPLWRLEAALRPGPIIPPPPPKEPSPEPQHTEEATAQQIESIIRTRKQRGGHQQGPPGAGLKVRIRLDGTLVTDDSPPGPTQRPGLPTSPQPFTPIVPPNDLKGVASAVVLRDAHCALLRAYEGRGLEWDKEPPQSVALYHPDSQTPSPWPERAAHAILAAPDGWLDDEARAAALKMAYSEYSSLDTEERMAILKGLTHLALSSEAIRDHFAAVAEAATPGVPRAAGKKMKAGAEAQEAEASATPAKSADASAASGTPAEWERWAEGVRSGVRKPLGSDLQGRRYWALGGGTSAWRVYVEEDGGEQWGWYDGAEIVALVTWLKSGVAEKETPLVKMLCSIPVPGRTQLTPTPGTPLMPVSATTVGEAAEGSWKGTVLLPEELELRRTDGYKGMLAPLLRGEGNWPKVALYAASEARIFFCADALLTSIPFWFKGIEWFGKLLRLSDALAIAKGPLETGRALLEVENMLAAAGKLRPEWQLHWQAPWRARLMHCYDMRDALMCAAALEEYVAWGGSVMHRHGFTKIAKDVGCQLYFPYPGEQVVVLRTGVLMHLKAYMQALGLLKDDPVASLRPVERYKVACIGYRRSLKETAGATLPDPMNDESSDAEWAPSGQWPTAWLLLRPSRHGPRHQLAARDIAVPLRIDGALPDFLVPAETFDRGLKRVWNEGDRFRMFFAARTTSKAGGTYYKGTVVNVRQQQPPYHSPMEVKEAYDPWEALEVEWDVGGGHAAAHGNDCERISPWELESDPDEDARREEEKKKEAEASARAARAARGARRTDDGSTPAEQAGTQPADPSPSLQQDAPVQPTLQPFTIPTLPTISLQLQAPPQDPRVPPPPLPDPVELMDHDYRSRSVTPYSDTPDSSFADAGAMAHASGQAHDLDYVPISNAPVKPVPREVLDILQQLSRDRFTTLLTNWYRGARGKFKVPIFAHRELDLHKVFWEVMNRGGFPVVTEQKQWKEICRCLEVDLTGQTSASYNMRLNYEKCLLEFEMYLASGQYIADLAAAAVPSAGMTTRSAHAPKPTPLAASTEAAGPGRPRSHPHVNLYPPAKAPALPQTAGSGSAETRKRSWRRMIAPADVDTDGLDRNGEVPPTFQAPPIVPSDPSMGPALHSLGQGLVGKLVLRFWPEDDFWWDAHVGDYTSGKGHKLIYEKGTSRESFEWAKLSELGPDELAVHPEHPLPALPPPPGPTLPPDVVSKLVDHPMLAINALLGGGFTSERLKALVDQAIVVHQALAQAAAPVGHGFAPPGKASAAQAIRAPPFLPAPAQNASPFAIVPSMAIPAAPVPQSGLRSGRPLAAGALVIRPPGKDPSRPASAKEAEASGRDAAQPQGSMKVKIRFRPAPQAEGHSTPQSPSAAEPAARVSGSPMQGLADGGDEAQND
ncbi:hypothetical protein WJX73_008882 [Symbiochloris irregularis]|uniref:Uncharacterized protein n=1 Tax=Symbiochloris irregularis TaxID=706552 RepID=A0AAW1P0D0_9CHLO